MKVIILCMDIIHPRENEQVYFEKYETHNREVEQYFADRPDKLLKMCFEEGDSWSDLLPFLGIESSPTADWPHANKAGTQPSHKKLKLEQENTSSAEE